ncbi:HBL106Cp [Eremothecium sinecaudum]|uniref:SWI5-dependent HO expression protein 3 n=1 Tax=Eremothecium sinecaudum TaxID=45286 RepID=A0A120K0Y7_9SACH|nr:HBL106Cp [Eremothecium sinecaudum]AMD18796.1 HBL106Cp [Eremothecium sinecaudum]
MGNPDLTLTASGSTYNLQKAWLKSAEVSPTSEKDLGSPTKIYSTSNLQVNHGPFIANMNANSTTRSLNNKSSASTASSGTAVGDSIGSHSPLRELNFAGTESSGKVIENLHARVDALARTNLELTNQSKQLLDKLDKIQTNETKSTDVISKLRSENANLNSMLTRKTRKIKELETQLNGVKTNFSEIANSHDHMKAEFEKKCQEMEKLEEKCQYFQAQYNAIADAQRIYREHYEKEISELRLAFENYIKDNEKSLKKKEMNLIENQATLDKKLSEYSDKFHRMEKSQQHVAMELNTKYDRIKSTLDLESWATLYKKVRETAIDYARQLDLTLSEDFIQNHGDDGYFVRKFVENIVVSPTLSDKNSIFDNSGQHSRSSSTYIPSPTIRIPKSRGNTVKKSNFFCSQESNVNSVASHTLLPGIKRNSSIRCSSARVLSDNTPDHDIHQNMANTPVQRHSRKSPAAIDQYQ